MRVMAAGRRAAMTCVPTAAATIFCLGATAQAAQLLDPAGTWLTEDKRARVRVEHCSPSNQRLCGYVVWLNVPKDESGRPLTDRNNLDPRKRSRPLLGHQMLLGLQPVDNGRFEGRIYNGDNGKTYKIKLWRDSPADLRLEGCMLVLLCGSQSWTLVNDLAPGQLKGATGSGAGPKPDVVEKSALLEARSYR